MPERAGRGRGQREIAAGIAAAPFSLPVQPGLGLGPAGARLTAEPCAIAYLGASVTVQRNGYRPRLHAALCRRFGREHRAIAAAVGAVGSDAAAFLMERTVLPHRPDLCLVEYATGDMGTGLPPAQVEAAVEGIAAKLERAGCAPCFLLLYRRTWGEREREVTEAWNRVAARRGIPTINVGEGLREHFESGRLDVDELIEDELHTTPAGGELIAGLLADAVVGLARAPAPGRPARDPAAGQAGGSASAEGRAGRSASAEGRAPNPAPDYRRGRLLPASPADAGGSGTMRRFRLQLPFLQVEEGERLELTPPGELLGFSTLVGPDSGEVEVSGVGGTERTMLWDEYCHYDRLSAAMLRTPQPPGEPVTVVLTGTPVDQSRSRRPYQPPQRRSLRVCDWFVLD